MRGTTVVIVGLTVGVLLAGCGSDDTSTSTQAETGSAAAPAATAGATATTAPKPTNIAFVSGTYTDFNQVEEDGMKEAVEPGGGKVEVFNSNFDAQKLLAQCKDVTSSGRFDAIVLEADRSSGPPCVAVAKAAGIPVIQLDAVVGKDPDVLEPQIDGIVGSVSLSRKTNAENSAALVKDACAGKDPCKVIGEIIQPPDDFYGYGLEYVKKTLPNVEVVQEIAGMFDPSLIAQKMPDVLTAHPDADVYLSTADSQALSALPAIKKAGLEDQVKVIGNGGSRLGAAAVADGTFFGTQGNWPKQGGKAAAEMAIKAVNGETLDPNTINVTEIDSPVLLTKATIGQFTPEWGAAG